MAVKQEVIKSFNVQIWCGLKEGYEGPFHSLQEVEDLCQAFVDEKKDCITITPTTFVYTQGKESGVIIGWIAYPRFPKTESEIISRAKDLANILMNALNQNRVTITTPQESIMLEKQ
jgi:hypothetical protein